MRAHPKPIPARIWLGQVLQAEGSDRVPGFVRVENMALRRLAQNTTAIRTTLGYEAAVRWAIQQLAAVYRSRGGRTINVVWVVSYPRSGSTWLREIISNCYEHDRVTFIPSIHEQRIRDISDLALVDLPIGEGAFIKSHTLDFPVHKLPLPLAIRVQTSGFLYVYRHPLDVLLSSINYLFLRGLEHFLFETQAKTVEELQQRGELHFYLEHFGRDFTIGRNAFLKMCGGNWLRHVQTYLALHSTSSNATSVLTYEGLQANPVSAVSPLMDSLGITAERLQRAVEATSQSVTADGKFFWRMTTRNYTSYFPPDDIARFMRSHAQELSPLGYGPS
jgi:hypothetical protein